jgi:hypothetical protein
VSGSPSSTLRWRYVREDGAPAGESAWFDDRAAAEAWLSATWQDLLDQGVAAVALVDREDVEAYRMPLTDG